MFERNNRIRPFLIRYALYLNYLGSILRNTSKALQSFVERSYVATIWYWINEQFDPKHEHPNKRKKTRITDAFIIDKTQIQIISNDAWLWVGSCGTN